jgi:hypothetical protein
VPIVADVKTLVNRVETLLPEHGTKLLTERQVKSVAQGLQGREETKLLVSQSGVRSSRNHLHATHISSLKARGICS